MTLGNVSLQPLLVTISKTADGHFDYMQIISQDQFALNIVLIGASITVKDVRPPVAAKGKKK